MSKRNKGMKSVAAALITSLGLTFAAPAYDAYALNSLPIKSGRTLHTFNQEEQNKYKIKTAITERTDGNYNFIDGTDNLGKPVDKNSEAAKSALNYIISQARQAVQPQPAQAGQLPTVQGAPAPAAQDAAPATSTQFAEKILTEDEKNIARKLMEEAPTRAAFEALAIEGIENGMYRIGMIGPNAGNTAEASVYGKDPRQSNYELAATATGALRAISTFGSRPQFKTTADAKKAIETRKKVVKEVMAANFKKVLDVDVSPNDITAVWPDNSMYLNGILVSDPQARQKINEASKKKFGDVKGVFAKGEMVAASGYVRWLNHPDADLFLPLQYAHLGNFVFQQYADKKPEVIQRDVLKAEVGEVMYKSETDKDYKKLSPDAKLELGAAKNKFQFTSTDNISPASGDSIWIYGGAATATAQTAGKKDADLMTIINRLLGKGLMLAASSGPSNPSAAVELEDGKSYIAFLRDGDAAQAWSFSAAQPKKETGKSEQEKMRERALDALVENTYPVLKFEARGNWLNYNRHDNRFSVYKADVDADDSGFELGLVNIEGTIPFKDFQLNIGGRFEWGGKGGKVKGNVTQANPRTGETRIVNISGNEKEELDIYTHKYNAGGELKFVFGDMPATAGSRAEPATSTAQWVSRKTIAPVVSFDFTHANQSTESLPDVSSDEYKFSAGAEHTYAWENTNRDAGFTGAGYKLNADIIGDVVRRDGAADLEGFGAGAGAGAHISLWDLVRMRAEGGVEYVHLFGNAFENKELEETALAEDKFKAGAGGDIMFYLGKGIYVGPFARYDWTKSKGFMGTATNLDYTEKDLQVGGMLELNLLSGKAHK